jgi:cation diffusion facilitator CzcD-associated flavoprotein CzcO
MARRKGSLRVVGRGGRGLHDIWDAEPRALLGVTVPGIPNFFMLYGPDTNGGEIFSNHRAEARWVVRSIKRLQRHGGAVDTRERLFDSFDRWLTR